MQSIITQVSQKNKPFYNLLFQQRQQQNYKPDYYNNEDVLQKGIYDNFLIHLNIQEHHYYITRDQLMSLPECLLLCLFPSGVFIDRDGQIISDLTPDDEVYITNFNHECFEYIIKIFTKAHEDLINYPVEILFEKPTNNSFINTAKEFFRFGNNSNSSKSTPNMSNNDNMSSQNKTNSIVRNLLHQKPVIIVLREDLDYYCVPLIEYAFEHIPNLNLTKAQEDNNNDALLQRFMTQTKIAAGSYLSGKNSVFQGLFSSNRLKYQNNNNNKTSSNSNISNSNPTEPKLGPAEKHLMDMLCSSGFTKESQWGNRTQEPGKTVISSLLLCRLENETTEGFRSKLNDAISKWENQQKVNLKYQNDSNKDYDTILTQTKASVNIKPITKNNESNSKKKRKKRRSSKLSLLTGSLLLSGSTSGDDDDSRSKSLDSLPQLYDLVAKPNINTKLMLFWRKPARKCWWGDEEIELEVEVYGHWITNPGKDKVLSLKLPTNVNLDDKLNKIMVPIRLHIRRVWTLELSVIGV